MNNEKRAKLSFFLLFFCKSGIALTLTLIQICFQFTLVEHGAIIFYAELNVAVPRVTKFCNKNRSKNFFDRKTFLQNESFSSARQLVYF